MRRSSVGQPALRVRNSNEDNRQSRSRLSSGTSSKRSSSGSRLSAGPGSRNSFGYAGAKPRQSTSQPANKRRTTTGRVYGDLRQDPRNITDRRFKEREIGLLLEFLMEHGYPHQLLRKDLSSPRSKEFTQIFAFMYGLIEPGYNLTGKIEENFPQLMKDLGYPFTISKTSMYAIGSPHTWPHLLAALSWLREFIQWSMSLDLDAVMFPAITEEDFNGVPLSKIFYNYCQASYHKFLEGDDTFEDLDNKLSKDIGKNSQGGDVESLVHENRRLKQELDCLQKQADPLIASKDGLATVKLDLTKITQYEQQLEIHAKQRKTTIKTLEEEAKTIEAELAVAEAENKRKTQILATQSFSQADVERINLQRRTLVQEIDAREKEKEQIQTLIWEEERRIAKGQEKIYDKCAEFNQKAHMLGLIPPTEELAQGIDYEMQPSLEDTHSNHFKNTIKPALTLLENQFMDKKNDAKEEILQLQARLEQINDHITDKKETVKETESQLHKIEEKQERLKKSQADELLNIQQKIERLQIEMKEVITNAPGSQSVHEVERKLEAAQISYERTKVENKKACEKLKEFMMEAAAMVIDHKTAIQTHMAGLVKEAEESLDRERQIDNEKYFNAVLNLVRSKHH